MISLISSAKSMNFQDNLLNDIISLKFPFSEQSFQLLNYTKSLTIPDIEKLMKVSNKIAELNYYRFQKFEELPSKKAIFAYDGDVYNNM